MGSSVARGRQRFTIQRCNASTPSLANAAGSHRSSSRSDSSRPRTRVLQNRPGLASPCFSKRTDLNRCPARISAGCALPMESSCSTRAPTTSVSPRRASCRLISRWQSSRNSSARAECVRRCKNSDKALAAHRSAAMNHSLITPRPTRRKARAGLFFSRKEGCCAD